MTTSYLPGGDSTKPTERPEVGEEQEVVLKDPKDWGKPTLPTQPLHSPAQARGFVPKNFG